MTPHHSQPASGRRAGRQLGSTKDKAAALLNLQQQAAISAASADPYIRWQQLLSEEKELQQLEAVMTVQNIRWSTAAWQLLHDRSEQLCRDMAACIEQMEVR